MLYYEGMALLGRVVEKDRKYFAAVDTTEGGARFKMEGPLRGGQQAAREDLLQAPSHWGGPYLLI